jgi:hypothetical protein
MEDSAIDKGATEKGATLGPQIGGSLHATLAGRVAPSRGRYTVEGSAILTGPTKKG